ncbi:MAG: hypothetical protein GY696_32835, partial [Gammaproteobacteria bacterium]|nr:hypothetical protein [Gammaproteobacteria bacterium]
MVSPLRRQICLNPVWLGELRSGGFAALSLGPFGLATRALSELKSNHPLKFGSSRRDQTGWLD